MIAMIAALTVLADIAIEAGDSTLAEGVYEPVQRILDQVRAVKVPSGWVISSLVWTLACADKE